MAGSRQFVTDDQGKKISVILPIEEYDELREDLDDLACAAERREEPSSDMSSVIARLREEGLVSDHDQALR